MALLAVSEGVIVSGDLCRCHNMFLYNVIFQTPGEKTRKARIEKTRFVVLISFVQTLWSRPNIPAAAIGETCENGCLICLLEEQRRIRSLLEEHPYLPLVRRTSGLINIFETILASEAISRLTIGTLVANFIFIPLFICLWGCFILLLNIGRRNQNCRVLSHVYSSCNGNTIKCTTSSMTWRRGDAPHSRQWGRQGACRGNCLKQHSVDLLTYRHSEMILTLCKLHHADRLNNFWNKDIHQGQRDF